MLGRTLKMAFWVTYDHIGKLILASIVWSLAVMAPLCLAFAAGSSGAGLAIALALVVAAFWIVLPVMSAGMAHLAKELIETRDGSIRTFFAGIALYWRRAACVGALHGFAAVSLATSAWFYTTRLRESAPWLGYAIGAVALWGLVFVGLMALLSIPTLVQKKDNVLGTLKLTAVLVLDNPVFAVALAVQMTAVTAIFLVLTPAMFFLYGGSVAVVLSCAYEQLARKYAAVDDENDEYLTRGLRDFLFPWKG